MKHAYLIMAHNNFYNLKILLKLLDDKRNDIYIHIDKNVTDFVFDEWYSLVKNANIHFVKRERVYWGTYSQIEAIKNLMKEATLVYHDYYHTLTGSDLPIKTQDEINQFFEKHKGKEFVGYAKSYNKEFVHQKNYFVKFFRSSNKDLALWSRRLRKILIKAQQLLNVDVMKTFPMEIKKGTDWYSITHEAVIFLLQNEPIFKKYFYKAIHPGEFFAQTILYNSKFKENIFCFENENIGCLRYIDWERGNPYIYREEDFSLLINKSKDYLFARKFDENVDSKIIKKIYLYLKEKDEQ